MAAGHAVRCLCRSMHSAPNGSTCQCESLAVELRGLTRLRLVIVPNKGGAGKAHTHLLAPVFLILDLCETVIDLLE